MRDFARYIRNCLNALESLPIISTAHTIKQTWKGSYKLERLAEVNLTIEIGEIVGFVTIISFVAKAKQHCGHLQIS